MTNYIQPRFMISYVSGSAVSMAEVKLRYWFTKEPAGELGWRCRTPTNWCSNASPTFVHTLGSEYDIEVSFSAGAGTLAPGGKQEFAFGIHDSAWGNFTQTDDYSFHSSGSARMRERRFVRRSCAIRAAAAPHPSGGRGRECRKLAN